MRFLISVLALLVSLPLSASPAAAAGSPKWLPTLLVPPRTGDPAPSVWDSLARIELENRWAASESLATTLVSRLEASPPVDSLQLGHALLYVANGLIKRRLHADSRGFASLERAIGIRERHAGATDPLAIWGYMLGAMFYGEAGKPEKQLQSAETAIQRLEGVGASSDPSWIAQTHAQRATALSALRRWDEARPEYENALELGRKAYGPEHRLLVPLLAEYGTFLGRQGDFDAARPLLQQAVHISEIDAGPGKSNDFLEQSLSRLASMEARAGDLAESLDIAARAYGLSRHRLGEEAVPTLRLRTLVAYRLLDLGDYAGGASLLQEIVPAMEKTQGPNHAQTLNGRLALLEALLETSDTTGVARELAMARQALASQDPLANGNWTYLLRLVADYERAKGLTGAARDTLHAAIRIERQKRDQLGQNFASLLIDLLSTFKGPADRSSMERAAADIDRLADSTSVRATSAWPGLITARAGAEARLGDREAAWGHALEAERLAREWLTYQVKALPDRGALRLASQLGDPCDLLVDLMRPEDTSTVWDRLVRWRGLVKNEVSRRRAPAGAPTDSLLAQAHERWRTAQRHLGQLIVSGAAHPEDPGTRGRFETARLEADEAERRFARLASAGWTPSDVELAEILERLEPNQVLVAFATGSRGAGTKQSLGAFVARGADRSPKWIQLGSIAEIEGLVEDWLRCLGRPPSDPKDAGAEEATCRNLGQKVRDRVWQPMAELFAGANEVFVVPEGVVHQVPWLALPETKGRYLADGSLTIRIIDAERDLLLPSGSSGDRLLAVGGPDFDQDATATLVTDSDPSRAWRCTGTETLALSPLPAAKAEAVDVAEMWTASGSTTVLLGMEASELAFKSQAHGHAVIHIATHGVMLDDSCSTYRGAMRGVGGLEPVASATPAVQSSKKKAPPEKPRPQHPWLGRQVWLALSGANRPRDVDQDENEGLLTAEEVLTLDLRGTEWVVLSACHSATAAHWSREGVVGMQRSFHLAGAGSVIASHWSIGDESTREWMKALYAARKPGQPVGAAVRDACQAILEARRSSGRSTHPFYWAAFTSSGE